MRAEDVLRVLGVLRGVGVDVWVGDGWGVDALVGRETRPHRDLDPMHPAEQEPTMVAADRPFGYPARCFVTGCIGGSAVPCLSAEQQVYFHQGYAPKERDRHDMAQLREAFGIDTAY
jgi:lincosamide nucleotidyltransferase A/C/D/E